MKYEYWMLIVVSIILALVGYGYIAATLNWVLPIVVSLFIFSMASLVVKIFSKPNHPLSWRFQLGVLGALVILIGIIYRLSYNVTMMHRSVFDGLLMLSTVVVLTILVAKIIKFKVPKSLRLSFMLGGIVSLLIGSFWVFPQSALRPTFVLVWCGLIVLLWSVNLVCIFQDVFEQSSASHIPVPAGQTVALASGTVFTMLALFPVLVISASLFTRLLYPL